MLVLLAYVGLAIVAGIAMAAIQGHFRVELGTYLAIVYGTWLVTVVALACVAVAVHAVVNQKFLGHAVVIGWFVLTQVAIFLGFTDRLLRFGNPAPFEYSDMNGFGPFLPRMGVLAGYQLAVAVVLLAVAAVFWLRGTADDWASRRRTAATRLRMPGVRGALALGLSGAAGVGGFYEYNTRVLNLAGSVKSAEAKQAAFERRYKPFEEMAQPRVVAIDVALDFFPERRAAAWRGVMTAVNRHDRPIDSLYRATARAWTCGQWNLFSVGRPVPASRTIPWRSGPARRGAARRSPERRGALPPGDAARPWGFAHAAIRRALRAAWFPQRRLRQRRGGKWLVRERRLPAGHRLLAGR